MPRTEGTIARKVLPVFIVNQQFGDERDGTYKSILNGLLKKYQDVNEKNADVEIRIFLLNVTSEGIFTSGSLINVADSLNDYVLEKKDGVDGTFSNVVYVLSETMSVGGLLSAEVGYYEPIIFFFIDDLEIDSISVKKIKTENEWFRRATKLALPFVDSSDKFKELLGTREAVFVVPKEFDENKVNEFVDIIYDVRINTITHSIQTNFSQTGEICAAMFRGAINEADEYSGNWHKFSDKQNLLKTLVAVDPIEESETDVGEPIILAGALATLDESKKDEAPAEPTDSEKTTIPNVDDDWASGS